MEYSSRHRQTTAPDGLVLRRSDLFPVSKLTSWADVVDWDQQYAILGDAEVFWTAVGAFSGRPSAADEALVFGDFVHGLAHSAVISCSFIKVTAMHPTPCFE